MSLMSATDMISPGQLFSHLLGTPTPNLAPGLSPGTLNELGNLLQSPAAALASARKTQAEAAGYVAEAAEWAAAAASAAAADAETAAAAAAAASASGGGTSAPAP